MPGRTDMTRAGGQRRRRGPPNLDRLWPRTVIEKALADYRRGEDTAKAIAARYSVDVKRLRRWADEAGCPRPPRGRRALREPSARQKKLLSRIGLVSLRRLGAEAGVSRQYLHSLAKRWPDWVGLAVRRIPSPSARSPVPHPQEPRIKGRPTPPKGMSRATSARQATS
jgi:hypothetical protein